MARPRTPRDDDTHSELGRGAEEAAYQFLLGQGVQLLARNFRCRWGEIDLIVADKNTVVFVEVRYRRSKKFGSAEETVDKRKQIRLGRAAQSFLQTHPELANRPARFDVVTLAPAAQSMKLRWIRDAFYVG